MLDPFLGSGTTMFVANQMGRDCVGIEIHPEYYEKIKSRLELPLFKLANGKFENESLEPERRLNTAASGFGHLFQETTSFIQS